MAATVNSGSTPTALVSAVNFSSFAEGAFFGDCIIDDLTVQTNSSISNTYIVSIPGSTTRPYFLPGTHFILKNVSQDLSNPSDRPINRLVNIVLGYRSSAASSLRISSYNCTLNIAGTSSGFITVS